VVPDIGALASETERFVSNAYNDYYCIPNSVVPKRERSQWRFTVLRLFKNINHAATREATVAKAAELLEKLYVMLCYSCRYTLFSAYDSFQSVGVSQEDFFRAVVRPKRRHENPLSFGVKDSVSRDPGTRAGISLKGRRSANQKSACSNEHVAHQRRV
jgi:hypothetical protein